MEKRISLSSFDSPHYGWIIIFSSALGVAASIFGQTAGVSVYTEPLMASFNISRVDISAMYMIGTFVSSLFLPRYGKLLDRIPSKYLMPIASVGLAASIFFLAMLPKLYQAFIQPLAIEATYKNAILLSLLALTFLGMRQFGQGQMTLIARTMLARWFESLRGKVVAFSGVIVAFVFGGAPFILYQGVKAFGWQGNLIFCACFLLFVAAYSFISYRSSPEEVGLFPDFKTSGAKKVSTDDIGLQGQTLEDAKQQRIFWALVLTMFLQALVVTAITFHMQSIGESSGVSTDEAFAVFFPAAVVGTIFHLLVGYSIGKVSYSFLVATQAVSLALASIGVSNLGETWGYILVILGFGLCNGLFGTLNGVAWAGIFGRKHVGAISGFAMGWMVCGSAVGPWVYSLSLQAFASFNGAHIAVCILALVLAVFSLNSPSEEFKKTIRV